MVHSSYADNLQFIKNKPLKIKAKWRKARKLDKKKYCSKYAKTNSKEDFAESVICWIAVRHRSDKITQFDVKKINHFIPNRLKFFDEMNFNMYPM